jgi:hypothetical protein
MKKTISLMLVLVLCMVAKGDFTFGEPTNLGPTINSSDYDFNPTITADELELYFISDRPGGEGTYDIWVSTRTSKEDDWGDPMNLGPPINTPDWQIGSCISPDGLELYWGDWGLWVARRATVSDPWGEAENDSLININAIGAGGPSMSSDGLSLFFSTWDPWDLYVSTRPTRDDLWSEPVNLGPTVNGVDSGTWENRGPTISADGLVLIFSSDRDPGEGRLDLWMTRRSTIDGPWSEPVNLGPTINIYKSEYAPEISADGRTLLFCAFRDSGYGDFDIWQVSIDPVVDLNGDGIVDSADMVIMVDNWGTDNSLCDIGPMPWGDGVVDNTDAEVLMSYYTISYNPSPADGCITDVLKALPLSWTPRDETTILELYFGTDQELVEDANISDTTGIYRGRQDTNSYMPPEGLEYNQTYYWRIDEAIPGDNARKGDVWSFYVVDYLIIDVFEGYTDYPPNEVFMTWVDGWGVPTNGATAGYPEPDFVGGEHYMEDTIVHSGKWSMPLFYDNSVGLSEVTRTLNADWTVEDVVELRLYYYGDSANAPEPMFVAVDNAVVTNDDTNAALVTEWTLWKIPLQEFVDQGVNLTNVGSMSIGFGNRANPVTGGEGQVFFDDIGLYLPPKQ